MRPVFRDMRNRAGQLTIGSGNMRPCYGRPQCSRRNKITAKNPWFDYDCIIARKLLNKATAKYNDDPTIEPVRLNFYLRNKEYRKTISAKKGEFLSKLTRDIESNHNIRWDRFKKLKNQTKGCDTGSQLDVHDMANFFKFFKEVSE